MGTKHKTSNSRLIFIEEDQHHHRRYKTDNGHGIIYEITLDPTHEFMVSATRHDPEFEITEELTDQELMDLYFMEKDIPSPSLSNCTVNWDASCPNP